MKLDIRTLLILMGLASLTQFIALSIQYRLNKTFRGIGWWLLGSASLALGFFFISLMPVRVVGILAIIGNPLLMFGHFSFVIGMARFLDRKERLWFLVSLYAASVSIYYYYGFGNPSLSARTVTVAAAIGAFSLKVAWDSLSKSHRRLTGATSFTGFVFLAHAGFLVAVVGYTLNSPPLQSYLEYSLLQSAAFVVPMVTGTLWTFGLILMVNERLNAENRESRENLERIFDTGPDAALILRLKDRVFVDVNEKYSSMSGYSRDEVIGSSLLNADIWSRAEDRERFLAELEVRGSSEETEFVLRRKDGSRFVGTISANILTINDAPHLVGIIHDITKRRLSEEALRESEETYRSILNASPDDITIADLQGRILMASPAANRMFGYEPGEGIGSNVLDHIAPEDMERARSNISRILKGAPVGPNEYRAVRKDGSTLAIEVMSGFVRGQGGEVSKLVFIVRDITERKEAEATKEKLIVELRDALANVKTLRGLLPICASCKKIRDDRGYWNQLEAYVRDHTEADFTHGMCPECIDKWYPGLFDGTQEKSKNPQQ